MPFKHKLYVYIFKMCVVMQVKPRSALMAEERKSTESPAEESPGKRRARRSPTPGVRSPAYSDISDDAAPPDVPPDDPAHRPFPVYHQVRKKSPIVQEI